jgi:hypothetical protein
MHQLERTSRYVAVSHFNISMKVERQEEEIPGIEVICDISAYHSAFHTHYAHIIQRVKVRILITGQWAGAKLTPL